MRAVVQRVSRAAVRVGGAVAGSVGRGFLVLIGVESGDGEPDVQYIVEKVSGLRVFDDAQGKMNLSLADVGGEILAVSQFTLLGDCRTGRRPSYTTAAPAEVGEPLYRAVVTGLSARGHAVATGIFRAEMEVDLVNDGPVTLLLDSRKRF